MRRGGWVLAAAVLALAGCTSSATSGSAAAPPPATATSSPGARPAATPAAAPTRSRTAAGLCPAATTDDAAARCLVASMNAFWTTQLHRRIQAKVVLGLPDTIPAGCRFPKDQEATHARAAFECPDNHTIYFGPVLLRNLHADDPADAFPERLAAVLGHELGHSVQDAVHQKEPTTGSLEAAWRFMEQQADCLSGVWAHGTGLDTAIFLPAARAMLTDVTDAGHVRDHGTVTERVAAVRRGLSGVAACHLGQR